MYWICLLQKSLNRKSSKIILILRQKTSWPALNTRPPKRIIQFSLPRPAETGIIVDAQLPPALAKLIAAHGHHAEHVSEIGLRDAEDSPIWDYAVQNDAIIVTKDEDFPHRLRQSKSAPVIVWLRIGNTSRRALLKWFESLLPQMEALIVQGDRLIE